MARAITIFCWFPPESDETGASSDGALTASSDSSRSTATTSRCLLTKGPDREPVERGHRGVLAHVQLDHQSFGQAVGRHVRRAVEQLAPRELLAADLDRSGRRLSPGQCTQERRLAVARHTGDAHDLALADRERDALEAVSAQPVDQQDRRLVGDGRVLRGEGGLEGAPDDPGEEVGVRDVLDRRGPARRAIAEDRDAIGDRANLAQPVRDVDDGRAA